MDKWNYLCMVWIKKYSKKWTRKRWIVNTFLIQNIIMITFTLTLATSLLALISSQISTFYLAIFLRDHIFTYFGIYFCRAI